MRGHTAGKQVHGSQVLDQAWPFTAF